MAPSRSYRSQRAQTRRSQKARWARTADGVHPPVSCGVRSPASSREPSARRRPNSIALRVRYARSPSDIATDGARWRGSAEWGSRLSGNGACVHQQRHFVTNISSRKNSRDGVPRPGSPNARHESASGPAGPAETITGDEPPSGHRHRRVAAASGGPAWPRTLAALGPVCERARLGHGARGLQRQRRHVEVLPLRSRALPRLPLERGRPGRVLQAVKDIYVLKAHWRCVPRC